MGVLLKKSAMSFAKAFITSADFTEHRHICAICTQDGEEFGEALPFYKTHRQAFVWNSVFVLEITFLTHIESPQETKAVTGLAAVTLLTALWPCTPCHLGASCHCSDFMSAELGFLAGSMLSASLHSPELCHPLVLRWVVGWAGLSLAVSAWAVLMTNGCTHFQCTEQDCCYLQIRTTFWVWDLLLYTPDNTPWVAFPDNTPPTAFPHLLFFILKVQMLFSVKSHLFLCCMAPLHYPASICPQEQCWRPPVCTPAAGCRIFPSSCRPVQRAAWSSPGACKHQENVGSVTFVVLRRKDKWLWLSWLKSYLKSLWENILQVFASALSSQPISPM